MNHEPEQDLMLFYVTGVADADEVVRAEHLLCAASPEAQAAYAEALALFHAVPLALGAVAPPVAVRDAIMGRVAANASSAVSAALQNEPAVRPAAAAGPYGLSRWPVYGASALAACLAVALTLTLWNNRDLTEHNRQLADRASQLSATVTGSESVLRSSHATLASLKTQDQSGKSSGRVLYCPVTRQYLVTVYGLSPLPAGKAYELWLITPDQRKVPAGMFTLNADGTATVMAHPTQAVDVAALAAVTDEPAAGSDQPTGSIHLAGALTNLN